MEKEPTLDGITINGQHVAEYLRKKEGDLKSSEILREHSASIRERYIKQKLAQPKVKESTLKVSKRVKYLSDREIRKELGIMSKPYATAGENILWIISEKGPVSLAEIEKELGVPKSHGSTSARLASLWGALGNDHEYSAGLLSRARGSGPKGPFFYSLADGVETSVEMLYRKSKSILNDRSAIRKSLKKGTVIPSPMKEIDQVSPKKEAVKVLKESLAEAITQNLGISVEINGSIEIIFKFK